MSAFLQSLCAPPLSEQKLGRLVQLLAAPGECLSVRDFYPRPPGADAAFDEDSFYWAFHRLLIREAVKGLLLWGSIGSGKSSLLELLLQSIAERFHNGRQPPEQLIMLDAKCNLVPLLAGLGYGPEDENVFILNPFDERGASWPIGEAAQEPAGMRHIAELFVPEEPNSTAPYFADAGRELVIAVMYGLSAVLGANWTLRDLLCALDSRAHIELVASNHPRAAILAGRILNDEKHAEGVLSSLGSKLGKFETIAALWDTKRSKKEFRIEKFLQRPGVLVLSNDPVVEGSLQPMNSILLTSLSHHILREPDVDRTRFWFLLDEYVVLKKATCVRDLANFGRSKGAVVAVVIQTIERLIEIYGDAGANDLLSHLTYKTFLHLGGVKSAEWAEAYFGKVRNWERSSSNTKTPSGDSDCTNFSLHERPQILASMFLDMPLPGPGRPFYAITDLGSQGGVAFSQRSSDEVFSWRPKARPDVPPILRRASIEEQTLRPWTLEEEQTFRPKPAAPSQLPGPKAPEQPFLPLRPRRRPPNT